MRRSQAPSQRGGFKCPVRVQQSAPPADTEPANTSAEEEVVARAPLVAQQPNIRKSSFAPPLPVKKPRTEGGPTQTTLFRPPAPRAPAKQTGPQGDATNQDAGMMRRYFKVVWCKVSNKKHKKWEDDAVLVVDGRTVQLNDMEGKCLAKTQGFKRSELENLKEGETLKIGGKEVEILSSISATDFESGQCYLQSSGPAATQPIKPPISSGERLPTGMTQFKPVSRGGTDDQPYTGNPLPKHDPSSPGAVVMPRPDAEHQRLNNSKGRPIVDVVIDPHLAAHLRPHQVEGVRFLYECTMGMRGVSSGKGAILADEMGLGKTLQCIALVWTLLRQNPYFGAGPVVKRALVVCPGSLVKNWDNEFKKWLGAERIRVFAVSGDKRVEEFISSPLYHVAIISYEMLRQTALELHSAKIDLVICDEGHRIKNLQIKTTQSILSLPTMRRVILTGTPVQNHLQEFYNMCEFVMPGGLGTMSTFHKVFESAILTAQHPNCTPEQKLLGEKRAHELHRLTAMFVLRRTQEVNNKYLPPKVEQVVFCRAEPLQLDIYRKILQSKLVRSVLETAQKGPPQLMCIMALKKVCAHPALLTAQQPTDEEEEAASSSLVQSLQADPQLRQLLGMVGPQGHSGSGKMRVVDDMLALLRQAKEKVVLVSHSTQTLDSLQALCALREWPTCRLDGQTPLTKRQPIVDTFNTATTQNAFVFLLSSKAGGVGLNLVGASRLILYDIDWNPATDLQAMARIWRDGQKRTVHIYRLLTTGTIEEKIFQRQIAKQALSGAVVQEAGGTSHFTREQLRNLFQLHEGTACNTHDLLDCACREHTVEGGAEADMAGGGLDDLDAADRLLDGLDTHQMGSSSKAVGMDALMDWDHYPDPARCPDGVIRGVSAGLVTFVFRNEANTQQQPQA